MRFIRFAMFSLFWAIIVAAFGTMGIQILLGLQDKLSGMPFLFLVDFSYIIVAISSSLTCKM